MRKLFLKLVASAAVAVGLSSGANAADISYDFNSDPALQGIILRGSPADNPAPPAVPCAPTGGRSGVWRPSGSHDGSGYVSLTDATCGQQGKMIIPQVDADAVVGGFTARFKLHIGGSTCCGVGGTGPGGTIQPADGFSFNFAELTDPAITATDNGGWMGGAAEEGTQTGLSVCIDTWDNADGEAPNIDLKVKGVVVATVRVNGNIFRNPELATKPVLNFDPRTGAGWADMEITLAPCGTLTLIYKGVTLFDSVPTGYIPVVGQFILGARTGGANDEHWVDDLSLSTIVDQGSAVIAAKTPANRFGATADTHIGFKIANRFGPVDLSSLHLFLDGVEVTPVVTEEPDPAGTTFTVVDYTPPGPLTGGDHLATLEFANLFAENCTAKNPFNIGSGVLYFIEAEDYNYSSGLHSEFGDPDGSLRNKVGTPEIDYHDGTVNNDINNDDIEYRPADQVEAGKGPNAGGDQSRDRNGRTITADWVIGWTASGDWANYTRTFPNAAYRAFVRWGSDGGVNVPMNLTLDEVTSSPAAPNQTLKRIGTFHRDTETGAWDGAFVYTPMLDAAGQPAAVRLSGLKTIRMSVGTGAMDYNYVVFVPDPTISTLRPTAAPSPGNATTSSSRDPQIKVLFVDRDTAVVPSSIRLTVNGANVTASSVITDTAAGAEITYQGTYAAGSVVNASVAWTDNDASPVTQNLAWSFTTGIIAPGTLFIEIEDFNYSDADGVNPGQHIEFGAPDGSLINKDATMDIDAHDADVRMVNATEANPGGDLGAGAYRPFADTEAGKGPSSVGEQDRTRGARTITADWVVGWTAQNDWLNYTRTFPTERYYVYARMASGAGATVPMNADLRFVTSDPTQPNQTTQLIGTFSHPRDTAGWDGTYIFVPMRDGAGNQASVRLSGKQTLRYTWGSGAHDAGYLALVPGAPPVRSHIISVSPPITREWPNPYAPLVKASIAKEDTGATGVKLIVDGVDRTADATLTETDGAVEISLQLPGAEARRHTARVEWSDTLGNFSHDWSFRQGPPYSPGHLFIELEDFNADSGQYFPSAGSVDFNTKGLYAGKGALPGIDYNDSGNCEEDQYRTEGTPVLNNCPTLVNEPNIGIVPHNDANRNGAGERPGFEFVSDYKMGWTDAAGDWYNYTRTFPAATYSVWARISHGDGNATMGGQLDLVTSDRTQPNQTLAPLGEFVAPASGNWDGFTFVPLTDANGDLVLVDTPAGEHTIRYSVKRNGGDLQYLMLIAQRRLECPSDITVGNDAGQCSAVVTFTAQDADSCSPASGSTFPVGTTTVTCNGTDAAGDTTTCTFNVTVEDREAPRVVVRAGSNPAGKIKAKNGDSNGFYQLVASDNCDTAPKIYVKDANSSFVAGPYPSGTNIKLVPNSGSNKAKAAPGSVDWHINTAGAAQIYATDASGNVSQPVTKSK